LFELRNVYYCHIIKNQFLKLRSSKLSAWNEWRLFISDEFVWKMICSSVELCRNYDGICEKYEENYLLFFNTCLQENMWKIWNMWKISRNKSKIWRNVKKIWRDMWKMWRNMAKIWRNKLKICKNVKKRWRNMGKTLKKKKYVGIRGVHEEICGSGTWKNEVSRHIYLSPCITRPWQSEKVRVLPI